MIRRLVIAGLLAGLGFGAWMYWRVDQVEKDSLAFARAGQEVPFDRRPVEAVTGFETLSGTADYVDAAIFDSALYVASSNALTRYRADGSLDRQWRAGFELPAAPIRALAAEERLWIATSGAGILVLAASGQLEQILPRAAGARKVHAVLPLASGAVLLATDKLGVLRLEGDRLRPILPDVHASVLAGTEEDLWIGTRNDGVIHLRAGQRRAYGSGAVHALAAGDGRAYAGTSAGIVEYADGGETRTLAPGILAQTLLVRGDSLHAGTLSDGWLRIPLAGGRQGASSGETGEVRRVFASGDDLYVVRPESVTVLRDERALRAIDSPESLLTHTNVSALQAGPDGRIWAGYFDRGLDIVDGNRQRKTHVEDDRVFCVNRIERSEDGQRMAVATANGLVVFDAAGVQRQIITREDGLGANHVTGVVANERGWIAATPSGLTFLDASPRTFSAFNGFVNNHVYAVARSEAQVVAGTLGGVSILEGEAVKRGFTTANSGLKTNWITAIARVRSEWWFGTYGGGVQRMDAAGAWHTFEGLPSGAVVNPNAMTVTPTAVYAGTLEHGLLVWPFAVQAWRSVTRGLPSSNVTAILYHGNRLYVGTDNGLVAAAESQFQ